MTDTTLDKTYEHDKKERKLHKLRIIYNKKGCVGSGHCMLSDPYNFAWDEKDAWKAMLIEGKPMEGPHQQQIFVKEIETDSPHLVMNAAKSCTPKAIAIFDIEKKKFIA